MTTPTPTPLLDALVIGGGPAGLSAALMLGRARRSVLVLDAGEPRNRTAAAAHAVLGHDGIAPHELLRRGREEVARYGVEVRSARVVGARATADRVTVTLDDGTTVAARAIVLASGIVDELPAVPGLAAHWGDRVLHCPYCHGWEVRERRLGVLATGPASLHQAELVRQWSDDVVLFGAAAGEALGDAVRARLAARGVRIVEHPVIAVETAGPDRDAPLAIVDAAGARHAVDALFTGGEPRLDDALVDSLGLERSTEPGAALVVDAMGAAAPRVWAAGNVVAPFASIPLAMASGTMAGAAVNAALVAEDGDRALVASPAHFWEHRYAGTERSWSGRANATLLATADDLVPGTALELGCGEGADALWLAERGWRVTALDIAPTAVRRAQRLAASSAALRSGTGSVEARVADLAAPWPVEGRYDLVVASFLHSPAALDRLALLHRALDRVAPGGRLLLITHVAPPAGAPSDGHPALDLPSPQEELDALRLDPAEWVVEVVETRARTVERVTGERHAVTDGVLRVRRAAPGERRDD